MLQIMNNLPEHVVGVRAAGQVNKDDYEQTLVPAIEKVAREFNEINFLMILETDVTNFSYGAWIQDAKISLKHYAKWRKVAIVTNRKAIEKISHFLSFVSPAQVKGFPLSDVELAKTWVALSKEATGRKH